MSTRKEEIVKLYDSGMTLQEIGNKYNISRQRVWQIVKSNFDKVKTKRTTFNDKVNPRPSEIYVLNKLKRMFKDANVEFQKYNSHYDILFRKKKIEVKYREKADKKIAGRYYYSFNYVKSIEPVDIYVFLVGDLKNPTSYIIPGTDIKMFMTIPVEPLFKTKYQRVYREKWQKYFGY